MQPLDGSQPDKDQDTFALQFLGDYIEDAVAKLKDIRVPPSFDQNVNGQQAYNVAANPEYFV
jgi:hypothetical protein